MEKKHDIRTSCDRGLCHLAVGRQDRQLNTYDWLADVPGNQQTTDLVEVQFKHTRKGYYHNVNNLPLKKGDIVAVEANPGHDIGVVTLTGRLVNLQIKKANQAHLSHCEAGGLGQVPRSESPRARHDD